MSDPGPDFPAAHSMDTGWYAVDRDGHVGYFDSGEAGAMPESAGTDEDVPLESLPAEPFALLDWLGESREEFHRDLPDRGRPKSLGPTLMFLDALDRLGDAAGPLSARHAPASVGVLVWLIDLPAETAWRLHEAGACLSCFPYTPQQWFKLAKTFPDRVGLYRYGHDRAAENWIAGPYVREHVPERPFRLDQLPPEVRDVIARARFEAVSFAEVERIQPVDHVPCAAWGNSYLDLDGRTVRPIPGREAEFNAEAWAQEETFRVELPGQGPPDRLVADGEDDEPA